MTGQPKPEGAFDRLRQTARRKGPLSFADLSATIVDAQKATGFVDTLNVEAPNVAEAQVAESRQAQSLPYPESATHAAKSETALSPVLTGVDVDPSRSPLRKGRVRAPVVQCNLKIPEELRDALHLQALRERRTIADLVSEIMTGYLTTQGTFERLRR